MYWIDGQTYTLTDRLLWLLARRVEENTVVIGKSLGNKRLTLSKHPNYPWTPPEEPGRVRFGNRGNHSSTDVMNYLDSL